MKKINLNLILFIVIIFGTSCEREVSEDAQPASFASTPDIFIDDFVGMGSDFYLPYGNSKFTAFSVDNEEGYNSNASIRLDVPNSNDPNGGYAGAILRVDGAGRNLTGYDALTFWAKASQGVTVGEFGFGEDFIENKFVTTITNVSIGTNWTKYIIPIPDASKLINERGVFRYAAGTQTTGGAGYILWLDDLKFEKLGTIAQPQPRILNGQNQTANVLAGTDITITGLTQTFNLANGQNQTVIASPQYFSFESSNTDVATVNELGIVSIIASGNALITASINGVEATGSLSINSEGAFVNAPNPTLPAANVLSIYSDFYNSVSGFNPGFFAGSNTDNISLQTFSNNEHINFESIDFVGTAWNGTVNVSGMNVLHIDVQLTSPAGSNLRVELIDFGPDNTDNGFAGSDGTAGGFIVSNQLVEGEWVGLEIPLSSFTLPTGGGGAGSPNLSNIGYVVFVSSNGASFLVDNIYFHN